MKDDDNQALRDELFRRVGRNLLNFQRLERMLKYLVSTGQLSGPLHELAELRAMHTSQTFQLTMGKVAGRFVDGFLSDAGEAEDESSSPDTPAWASISIRFEMDVAASAELRDGLRAVVEERNELVHHVYDRWDGKSAESTQAMLDHLDAQRERLIPIFDRIRGMTQATMDGIKEHAEYLSSPEADQAFELMWLRQRPLVQALEACATELAREDGWLALSTAAQVLKDRMPAELVDLQEHYGHSTLKRLMLATGLFDIWDEPTARGFRTVYRRKLDAGPRIERLEKT